jgi:asparagine synthase (glutamine-hydrolysing)
MCGIAAIFAYDERAPAVEPGELRSIRERMIRRGPDGAGEWLSPDHRIGLAHRRLSIIDLSDAGAQPMADASGRLHIVFNGEIYNYRELRAELEATGVRFRSHSDTEVLLHLFARHGEDMLVRLRGMFAFALWDSLRGKLFLARDPFGIKPLYYADDGRTLRVASQVKALLAGGAIDTAPDPAGHVGFHLWGHVPEPFTFFRGVRQLPAGTSLWVDASGCGRPKTFCDIAQLLAEAGRTPAAAASGTGPLTDAVADSVTHHLIADVPVGVFLSAGLDSTTLARSVSAQGADLRTVTLGFEEFRGTPQDEAPWAERVAAQLGARHQTIRVTRSDFTSHFEDLLDQMDQPTTDGVNSYFVSLAARRAGLKVALSGLGADEILGIPASRTYLAPFPLFGFSAFQRFGPLPAASGRSRARCSRVVPRPSTPACSNTGALTAGRTSCAAACSCLGNCRACSIPISCGRAGNLSVPSLRLRASLRRRLRTG